MKKLPPLTKAQINKLRRRSGEKSLPKKKIKLWEHPKAAEYPTPEILTNKHEGAKVLIIGTGPSCKQLIEYRAELSNQFDVIIGLNFSVIDFENQLDYHIVLENKPTTVAKWLNTNKNRKAIPRIVGEPSLRFFSPELNLIKANRSDCNDQPNIEKYKGSLFWGYTNILVGASVTLQAMHLAAIMGGSKIYTIGVESYFINQQYYFSKDNAQKYRITHKPLGRSKTDFCKVTVDGTEGWSLPIYVKTAKSINRFAKTVLEPAGIEVYDFSQGLLTTRPVQITQFFNKE